MIWAIDDRVFVRQVTGDTVSARQRIASGPWPGVIKAAEPGTRRVHVLDEDNRLHLVPVAMLLPGFAIPRVERCRDCGALTFSAWGWADTPLTMDLVPEQRWGLELMERRDQHDLLDLPAVTFKDCGDTRTMYRHHQCRV